MKVVVAIDSMKGSLSSMEAGRAAAEGILRAVDAKVCIVPVADGGEGTAAALTEGLRGERVRVRVSGPLGERVTASYGYLLKTRTAVMEMAEAAGLTLTAGRREPLHATTYGVGEMLLDALDRGCRDIIIGIGGSATNDAGMGMLAALGYEFLDRRGERVGRGAGQLERTALVRADGADPRLGECRIRVACDVKNPLCGENGATYVYGPQKGVTASQCERIDRGMEHFADVTARFLGKDNRNAPGAGAAGGLGFAFLSYLNASLEPGIGLVLDAVGIDEYLRDADFVVTGEGRLDGQTVMGKAPAGIAARAKKYGARVIALAGCVSEGAGKCIGTGIDAYFPIVRGPAALSEAMDRDNAARNMTLAAEQVFRLIAACL